VSKYVVVVTLIMPGSQSLR